MAEIHTGGGTNKSLDIQHDEYAKEGSPPTQPSIEWDKKEEKKLIRRVDRRLLPMLGVLYSIALIDRVNISAARISGMEEDLRLDIGNRYTIALVVFFPPYFVFELPSNIVLRKVGSANWLAFIAFAWGTVMIGQVCQRASQVDREAAGQLTFCDLQAFVKSYGALAACRFLLGLFESGVRLSSPIALQECFH